MAMKKIAMLIHPGEILEEELEALGRSQTYFAKLIGKTPQEVNHIITGKRNLNMDWAIRIWAAFWTTAQMWINLQNQYDFQLLEEKEETKHIYDSIRLRTKELTLA